MPRTVCETVHTHSPAAAFARDRSRADAHALKRAPVLPKISNAMTGARRLTATPRRGPPPASACSDDRMAPAKAPCRSGRTATTTTDPTSATATVDDNGQTPPASTSDRTKNGSGASRRERCDLGGLDGCFADACRCKDGAAGPRTSPRRRPMATSKTGVPGPSCESSSATNASSARLSAPRTLPRSPTSLPATPVAP